MILYKILTSFKASQLLAYNTRDLQILTISVWCVHTRYITSSKLSCHALESMEVTYRHGHNFRIKKTINGKITKLILAYSSVCPV